MRKAAGPDRWDSRAAEGNADGSHFIAGAGAVCLTRGAPFWRLVPRRVDNSIRLVKMPAEAADSHPGSIVVGPVRDAAVSTGRMARRHVACGRPGEEVKPANGTNLPEDGSSQAPGITPRPAPASRRKDRVSVLQDDPDNLEIST